MSATRLRSWPALVPARKFVRRVKHRNASGWTAPYGSMSAAERAHQRELALTRRLRTFIEAIDPQSLPATNELQITGQAVAVALARVDADNATIWFAYIAFLAQLPVVADLERASADFDLLGPEEFAAKMLQASSQAPDTWALYADIEVVAGPIVDVTHTAGVGYNTGIQRVVRETVPRWAEENPLTLVALDRFTPVLRRLSPTEVTRILDWGNHVDPASARELAAGRTSIMVPWRTTFIVPEVPASHTKCAQLHALARYSGCETSTLVHDIIPISMPDVVVGETRIDFLRFTTFIRSNDRVTANSRSVERDLLGLREAYRNMGINGPEVCVTPLPLAASPVTEQQICRDAAVITDDLSLPIVLSVSTIEPRKNQIATLRAAERLWREGHKFQLVMIGRRGRMAETIDAEIELARQRGRPLRMLGSVSEDVLWSAYHLARFTVFVSFSEGFGLPAAESIAAGTPVVLSHIGSMIEIGEPGGAEFVNPYNLTDITNGIRRLLTDDTHLKLLRSAASSRTHTTWDQYATSTWNWLAKGIGAP